MACLGRPPAFLQPRGGLAVALPTSSPRHSRSSGRWAAHAGGSGWAVGGLPGQTLQARSSTLAIAPLAASRGRNSQAAAPKLKQRGPKPSPVPEVDAEQLLRSLGLDGAANPAALLDNLRKLPGVRQQGVLDNAAAVAAHLLSPAVGLPRQQAGQLLERCPVLFSWPVEQRAAVLFSQLTGAGMEAAAAAQCLIRYPVAAGCTTFAPGLAELAAILAHSKDRQGRGGGPQPLPASMRTVAVLLTRRPGAVQLLCSTAGRLQQRAAELQQAGYTAAQVAGLAWDQPAMLWFKSVPLVKGASALLQQELGLTAAQVDSLRERAPPRWLTCNTDTLRKRASALVEVFGREAVAAAFMQHPQLLSCPPASWQRSLCCMAACGVADPKPIALRRIILLELDHTAAGFLQRRLLLQQTFALTAAQLFERHPHLIHLREPRELAQRLQFVEHSGQAHRLVVQAGRGRKPAAASAETRRPALTLVAVTGTPTRFLAAVGASEAEWQAWAAANPPEAWPLYRWAQQAAAEEAARLAAALPPELRQQQRQMGEAGSIGAAPELFK